MERVGMRQADLARAAELDQSTVSRWLSGAVEPNLPQLQRLLRALGVPAEDLLGETARDEVRLVRGQRQGEWQVFVGDGYVGTWVGKRIDVFRGGVAVDGVLAKALRQKAAKGP
jgi:transcriptional regulator with XRE-family HTH domain